MANNINRLTLSVALNFDKTSAQKEAIDIQKKFDKLYADSMKKQKGLQTEIAKAQSKVNKTTKEQVSLFGKVKTALAKTAITMLKFATVAGTFRLLTGIIKEAIGLAFDLDTAFTNFAIVSKATASEIESVDAQVDNLTLSLGKLKKEVIDTVTEFNRAGFSIQESLTLAENAIKGANVGATELGNVTTFLIAGLKAFNLEAEDSSRILDVLFRVANTTAINLEGIGEAFLRSANTLATAGASLEEASALIAGANESIQDPAKVGTALKTIASRLRGVTEAGETIPKLKESFDAVGISIQNADGSFRNIFDVFQDLAKVLPTLDDLTRESLLEKLAGKRQKNIVIGLLNNFDTAEQALKDALNSTGEVARANEKFLDSLQGRTNQLKEAWNQLLTTFTNSDALKAIVTGLKDLLVAINGLIKNTPKAIPLIVGLGLAFSPFGAIPTVIGSIIFGISGLGIASDLTRSNVEKLNTELQKTVENIANLDSKIAEQKSLDEKINKQSRYVELLERERDIELDKKAKIELDLAKEKNVEIQNTIDLWEAETRAIEEASKIAIENGTATLDQIEKVEKNLAKKEEKYIKEILALEEINDGLRSTDEAYKLNEETIKSLETELQRVYSVYDLLGISIEENTENLIDNSNAFKEQIDLFKEVQDLIGTASNDYQLLSDALEELETQGYLSDDMLNTLIETYPELVASTGLAVDAFREQTQAIKVDSIEQADALIELARVEIETAKQRIEALKAVSKANQTYSFVSAFREADVSIKNAETNIALLENEKKQLEAIDKARKDATTTTQKETKVLTDQERALNELNFQIELRQKLLARTQDEETQIKINNELVDLYTQQRDALLEQQRVLDEQSKSIKKGTEEYDDYIENAYEISLAIEDATNNIVSFTRANKELEKSVAETKFDSLAEELESIGESINNELQNQIDNQRELAQASEDYYDTLIANEEEKLKALKASNDEKEKEIEYEKLLQNLQDLRERRQNILNNKSARIVKDAEKGFEFIADPRELAQVNEDILNAEQAIDEFRREQAYSESVGRLEATIEGLEKEAEAEQRSYDKRIEILEFYQNDVNEAIQEGGNIDIATIQTIQDTLALEENNGYGVRLNQLDVFIGQYNAKVANLNSQKAEVDRLQSQILSAERSIAESRARMDIMSSTPSSTSTVGSTSTSANVGSKVSVPTSSSTSTFTVHNMNVKSDSKNMYGLIKDATGRIKVMSDM